jgi:hypothetical protein
MTSTNFRQHPTEEDYDVERFLANMKQNPKKKRRKLSQDELAFLDKFLFEDET